MKRIALFIVGTVVAGLAMGTQAKPGDGIMLGESKLVPYLDLKAGYDSNVQLRARALGEEDAAVDQDSSDNFYAYTLGLRLNRTSEQYSHYVDGYWREKRYSDFDQYDKDAYGVRLGLRLTDSQALTLFNISGSMERVTDVSSFSASPRPGDLGPSANVLADDTSERLYRDIYLLSALLHRDFTPKTYGEATYRYYAREYDSDAYFSSNNNNMSGALGYRISDKTSSYLRAEYGMEDNDSYLDPATTGSLQLGLRSWGTEKLVYDLGVGYQYYDREDTVDTSTAEYQAAVDAGAVSGDLKDDSPKFNAGLSWLATDKLTLNLSAHTGYVSSSFSRSNGSRYILGQAELRHRTTQRLTLAAIASYRNNDFIDPVMIADGSLIDEERETVMGRLEATYGQAWYRLFGRVWYEDSTSNIPRETYDRLFAEAGVRLQY